MYGVIKFFHYFALMLGAAGGIANMVVAAHIKRAGGTPAPMLAALRPVFAKIGLAGIVLIWITGVLLYRMNWSGMAFEPAFVLKLIAAFLILAALVAVNVIGSRSAKAGTPPPAFTARLGPASGALSLLAVALAVYVFG